MSKLPVPTNRFPFLDRNGLPNFLKEFTDAAAKLADKNDVFGEDDSFLSAIPFGKIANFFVKKAVQKNKETALGDAITVSQVGAFTQALHKYRIQLHLSDTTIRMFKIHVEELRNGKDVTVENFHNIDFNDNTLVKQFQQELLDLLKDGNIEHNDSMKIMSYVRGYGQLRFIQLLEDNTTSYHKLNTFLDSSYYQALRRQKKWEWYQEGLKELYHEVTLKDEKGMTLADIYVEPDFGVYEKCLVKGEYKTDDKAFVKAKDLGYDDNIHSFALDFLQGNKPLEKAEKPDARFLLVYGYPGQGKTSFCKRLLNDVLTTYPIGQNVYFVKFKDIQNPQELLNNPLTTIANYLREESKYELEVNKRQLRDSVLILDGLDELLMKNDLKQSDIEGITKELIRELERHERLKIIVTSRYGYMDLRQLTVRELMIVQLSELSIDQQKEWLSKYEKWHTSRLSKERLEQINKRGSYLKELITQPILLHLIASLEEEIDLKANRAKIYEKLFDQITNPLKWKDGQIEILEGLRAKDLRKYIRELAFEMFRSGDNYLHKSRIEKLSATEKFKEKLLNCSFKDALKTLMVAFYFQDVQKSAEDKFSEDKFDYAIEFLHKSLQEYLAAEKIWETCKDSFLNKDRHGDYHLDQKEDALRAMDLLLSDQRLTKEITNYLIELIQNDDIEARKEVANRMAHFLDYLVGKSFIHSNKGNPQERIQNGFYGYWTILSYLIPAREDYIGKLKNRARFIFLLELITKTRAFHKLNLAKADLRSADLIGADLRSADLSHASLSFANLSHASLSDAELRSADLRSTELSHAYLSGANLSHAYLSGADLSHADLSHADLSHAYLRSADLIGADLSHAYFSSTNLFSANLIDADLSSADLSHADLHSADLENVLNLTLKQLLTVKTLYQCKNLDPKLETEVRKQKPELFDEPE